MKMRKLGALLMAGVMAVSILLAGCGNGASGNISDGNSAQTENADRGERKKITILMRASETSAKCIIMKKLLTEFSEEKGLEPPEFEMISSSDADYMTKLQLYINSNTLPDIKRQWRDSFDRGGKRKLAADALSFFCTMENDKRPVYHGLY